MDTTTRSEPRNKRLLLVDDDPLVLRMYRDALTQQGFQVEIAGDGLAATKALRVNKPDLMVLDLMMPRFSGVEVLKFVRSQPALAALPVVVLSNSYMNELSQDAAAVGVQKALLKIRCTPSVLTSVIHEILEGKATSEHPDHLLTKVETVPVPVRSEPAAQASTAASAPKLSKSPAQPSPAAAKVGASSADAEFNKKARQDFLGQAEATCVALRNLFQGFMAARSEAERSMRLQDLYRKVHFVSATAGLADCHRIAQMASVFEALLFEIMADPARTSPSVLRTCAATVDFFGVLFQHARDAFPGTAAPARALVVEDDLLTGRMVVSALNHAQVKARSIQDPLAALDCLQQNQVDLILLDIEMPKMNGLELCQRVRALPAYRKTPVIYVTGHSDFETRTKSLLSGGDDLIAKPILPMELAVKVVTHLLKSQLPG